MRKDARFFFANLTSDVARLTAALRDNDEVRCARASTLAQATLNHLRNSGRLEAYEEGLLMLQGAYEAAREGRTPEYAIFLARLGREYAPRLT